MNIPLQNLLIFLVGALVGSIFTLFLVGLYFFLSRHQTDRVSNQFFSEVQNKLGPLANQALDHNSRQFLTLANETLSKQTQAADNDLETKKQLIDQTLVDINSKLINVQNLVNTLEKDREEKFGELTEQLKNSSNLTIKLQETTEGLRAALSNARVRGQWGERMAEDILRAVGFIEGINYKKQSTLGDAHSRPDYTFMLPNGLVVNMDVKFPLDNYLKALDSQSENEQEGYFKLFIKDVRDRIKELKPREYINPQSDTIDYAIVFIPNDQVFSLVQQRAPDILDEALCNSIIMCSPMTLFAVLSIIRRAMDSFYLQEGTKEILKVLASFQKQWGEYVKCFDSLGKKINDAQAEFNKLTTTRERQLDR